MQLLRDVLKAYSIYNETVGYCQVQVNTSYERHDVGATAYKNAILNFN